jgi:hypothetical protein
MMNQSTNTEQRWTGKAETPKLPGWRIEVEE